MMLAPAKYKQVIVLRTDLGMSKGKMIAQGGHAVMLAVLEIQRDKPEILDAWLRDWYTKITCKVKSQDELLELEEMAYLEGVSRGLVKDLGRTEIPAGTFTAIAIGPDLCEKVDKVTGHLKLL